jgi:hypothetical protein
VFVAQQIVRFVGEHVARHRGKTKRVLALPIRDQYSVGCDPTDSQNQSIRRRSKSTLRAHRSISPAGGAIMEVSMREESTESNS